MRPSALHSSSRISFSRRSSSSCRLSCTSTRLHGSYNRLPEKGGEAMPTYILLSSLTPQGVQTLKSNPDRLREVNKDVEELGAKVVHQWATLGEYDFVNVVEAPDSATIARVSVALGARGSTKIRTLTALTIDEFLGAVG